MTGLVHPRFGRMARKGERQHRLAFQLAKNLHRLLGLVVDVVERVVRHAGGGPTGYGFG